MGYIKIAIEKIEKQQGKERTAVWMVGEQLKDICLHEPECAELIAQDLENPTLSLSNAEKKIKAYADAHKTGGFSCVTPAEAERILRDFYSLPKNDDAAVEVQTAAIIDLEKFL